jgi:hypothetical protein
MQPLVVGFATVAAANRAGSLTCRSVLPVEPGATLLPPGSWAISTRLQDTSVQQQQHRREQQVADCGRPGCGAQPGVAVGTASGGC